jgi:hypothetical protein
MTPRGYDRYMVKIGIGTHPKFARLTDAEFRAHVVGVLAVAASATERGCLMVGHLPAEPIDIAATAGVTEKAARSAMAKLEAVGVLQRDDEHGCLRVHDWHEINPPPGSSTDRMRRHRASQTNGGGDVDVTPGVTEASHRPSQSVTNPSNCPSPEVEVEVEELLTAKAVSVAAAPPPDGDLEDHVAYLAHLASSLIRTTHGYSAKSKEARPIKAWHDACRAMIVLDGFTAEQIEYAIRWVCKHHYWSRRIRSMTRLRSEMEQVVDEIRKQRDSNVVPMRGRRENASDWLRQIDGEAS